MLAACDTDTNTTLTDAEMIENSVVFIIAGSGTSATTVLYVLYEVSKRPQILDRLTKEICDAFPDPYVMPDFGTAGKLVSFHHHGKPLNHSLVTAPVQGRQLHVTDLTTSPVRTVLPQLRPSRNSPPPRSYHVLLRTPLTREIHRRLLRPLRYHSVERPLRDGPRPRRFSRSSHVHPRTMRHRHALDVDHE